MLYSKKGNFIFIANPKTGTSSFQDTILNFDDSAMKNTYREKNLRIKRIPAHASAKQIKHLLKDNYNLHYKISFIRNPYDKAVSAYFFLQNARPLYHGSVFNYNKSLRSFLKAILNKLKIFYAKTFPFEIWSLLNTKKRNISYLIDNKKNLIVNYVCRTEELENDLKFVFDKIDYQQTDSFRLAKYNKSKHKDSSAYFSRRWHKYLFDLKYKEEIKFYHALNHCQKEDLYGKSIYEVLQ